MERFYYEDAERPWEPDDVLQRFLGKKRGATSDSRLATGAKALDLGMGYGRNAIWLAERGHEVEGWEAERRYVVEARREAKRRGVRLMIRRGDFTRGGWRGRYDIIVISQALHQVRQSAALKVLAQAKKMLVPGGKLFLLAKLTSDRHVERVRRDPAWRPMRGEKNTWLRPEARKRGSYHPGRTRTPQMILSALEPGEIRQALKGLRVRHWRTVVLRSDWEEEQPVTHTVAEVVAERV